MIKCFYSTFAQSPNICRTLHAALCLIYRALRPRSSSLVYHLSGRFVLTRVFSLGCGVSFLRHTHARPVSFYSTQGHPLALRGLRILVSCGSLLKHLSRDDITFEQTLLSTHALGTTFSLYGAEGNPTPPARNILEAMVLRNAGINRLAKGRYLQPSRHASQRTAMHYHCDPRNLQVGIYL